MINEFDNFGINIIDYCLQKRVFEGKNLMDISGELAKTYNVDENKMILYIKENIESTNKENPEYINEALKKMYLKEIEKDKKLEDILDDQIKDKRLERNRILKNIRKTGKKFSL